MPWNCLCSSTKKEKRPQISAPILEPNDKQVVIQPRQQSAQQLEQKLDGKNVEQGAGVGGGKAKKKGKKSKQESSKKKSKKGKNNNGVEEQAEDEKLRQFTHVQFQFDDYSDLTQPDPAPMGDQVTASVPGELKITEENDFNGNYDELPLVRLDDNRNITTLSRSNESIPFIDDEPPSRFETRIITLIPKNLEHHNLMTPTSPKPLQSFLPVLHPKYQDSPPKPPRAHLRVLPKIDESRDSTHKFQYYYNPGYRVCQICHLYLHVCPAIKCFECEFVCHQQCFDKPNHRYADTAYLIFRQWKKGGPCLAFPHLAKYYPDEQLTGSRKGGGKRKVPPPATYRIKDGLGKNKTEKRNFKKRRSRRSTSDEEETVQEKPKEFHELDEIVACPLPPPPPPPPPPCTTFLAKEHTANIDEVELFDTQLRIDEPGNTDSSVIECTEIEVNVDIHRDRDQSVSETSEDESTVIEANNNSLKIDDQQLIAEGKDPGSVKERLEKLANELVITEDFERRPFASMSVPIRRKQYVDLDIDSLSSEQSDLDDAETFAQRYLRTQSLKNNYDEEQQIIPRSRSFPVHGATQNGSAGSSPSSTLRLHYITERILASVLPARSLSRSQNGHHSPQSDRGTITGAEEEYEDEHERELISMLEQKHGKNYRVFDLESCLATITLEKLCELCKHIDSWLGSGRDKVVVLQDRGDRQRLGSAIAAYLEYQRICGSSAPLPATKITTLPALNEDRSSQHRNVRSWLDLDLFSMRKFLEELVGPLHVPSYKRYIEYFAGLLSGQIRMNSAALHLNYVILESPPCLHFRAMPSDNEWRSFIKIYEGQRCVFISDVYIVPITTKQFIYEIKHPLRLRGDVIIRCFQLVPSGAGLSVPERELIASVQFHTCAIMNTEVVFKKADLDFAYDDERFPNDHKITLIFINPANPNDINRNFVFQNPLVRVEPLSNCSSLDNLSEVSSHTHGPLDGSVYATILKSPKSFQSSPPKPLRTSSQSLISPPAEFSGGIPKFAVEAPAASSTPAGVHTYGRSASEGHYEDIKIVEEARHTPTPSVISYASSSKQSQRGGSARASPKGSHNAQSNGGSYENGNAEPRETVRSPLTLSMDSGISSSGIVNHRRGGAQGSSVSPTSFPSQASPQEDRHRELDDLLSDMLMTVQDIPDISSTQTNTIKKSQKSQHLAVPGAFGGNGDRRSLTPTPSQQQQQNESELRKTERELIMSLSGNGAVVDETDHSVLYPQQARIETLSITSDTEDDQIPYHAREDSRPFTYGNINSGRTTPANTPSGTMLKMQSGLSSPSMVRRVVGGEKSKPAARNEFEEMLLERREKILADKYSIGDSKPQNGSSWYGSQNGAASPHPHQNGYHNELLKRSNTMDGSFGRSPTPSDGSSGQTWLQLQQQKLRLRREAQGRDYTDNYSRNFGSPTSFHDTIHHSRRSQTLSPVRPERNYHTISKTTYTSNEKERPFVSVNRAHQLARQGFNSTPASPITALNAAPLGHISHVNAAQVKVANAPSNSNIKNGLIMFSEEREHIERSERSPSRNGLQLEAVVIASHTKCSANHNNNININNHNAQAKKPHNHNNNQYHKSLFSDVASGQLALDKLLASLALESDVNEQHLANIENNNCVAETNGNHLHDDLSAIIADLTEFTESSGSNTEDQWPMKDVPGPGFKHQMFKRLTESSEYSSSISPSSLSERSNGGVSWTEQAREESYSQYHDDGVSPRPETPAFPVTPRTPNGYVSSPALPPKSPTTQRRSFLPRRFRSKSLTKCNPNKTRPRDLIYQCVPLPLRQLNQTSQLQSSSPALLDSYLLEDVVSSSNEDDDCRSTPTLCDDKDYFSPRGGAVESYNHNEVMSNYTSRRNSVTSNANSEPQEVAPHHIKFVQDSSKYWYKPNISREEAVNLLRHAAPGTFIVRDSTTFASAFGLVLKVAVPPKNVQQKGPVGDELVRHFLVEPTQRGVRLKGCSDEPVFGSLSALVYQHSITPLALPCRLIIPDRDIGTLETVQNQVLTQGAACNVLYLITVDTESLTGPQAVRKAVSTLFSRRPLPSPTEVHFKVSQQGITLTDNTRRLFFRKHYPSHTISHCGLDPDEHRWSVQNLGNEIPVVNHRIYAFVAKRTPTSQDNQCHVFCEFDTNQPATAIVSFANRVILSGYSTHTLPKNI